MATGDLTIFNEFVEDIGEEIHNFESTDTLKLAIITTGVTPAADTATPQWGAGSSQDYDGNEVSTAGGYPAGGITLQTLTYTRSTITATLDADNISLSQNGSGFTNGAWGILYNDSATNKNCIAFVELSAGGTLSEQAGPININWNASGILTVAVG